VSEILTQVDQFTLILSIVICIISLLAYRENRSRMPLFVGIGFAILGLSYLITIISSTQSITSLVLVIRMCAFVTVLYAVYTNLGEARNQLTVLSEKNTRLESEIAERNRIEHALRNSETHLNAIIRGFPMPQFVIDKDHHVLFWNDALEEYSGIRAGDIIGTDDHWKAFYQKKRPTMADLLVDGSIEKIPTWYAGKYSQSLRVEGAYEATDFIPRMGKEGSWLHFTAAPIRDASGTIIGAVETLEDVTARVNAENKLSQSEEKYRLIADYNYDWEFWIDRSGKFVYNSPSCERITGYRAEEFTADADLMERIVYADDRSLYEQHFSRIDTGLQEPDAMDFRILTKSGEIRWINHICQPIYGNDGECLGRRGSNRDITERRQIDEYIKKLSALKELLLGPYSQDERLKFITDGVVEIWDADFARIWMLEKGDLCEEGCIHAAITGGSDDCHDRSRCLHLIVSSGRYTRIDGGHRRVPLGAYKIGRAKTGQYPSFVTNDVTHDPRIHNHEWAQSLGLVSFAGYQLSSDENTLIGVMELFSTRTITPWEDELLKGLAHTASQVIRRGLANKALSESEAKYRSLTENTPDIVFAADMNGTITYASPKIKEYGFLAEEITGRTLFSFIHPDDRERVRQEFTRQLSEQARFDSTFRMPDKWESIHFFEARSNLVLDDYGNRIGIDGILRDITDREHAEHEIRRSLQEKEVLLKEIHHRVKNNLQVVYSLIDLQVHTLKDQNMINILHDSQNRVRTMSLIHETLYRSDDLSHIRISQYLQNLVNALFSTYSASPERIRAELDIEDIQLDVESAIPCGLIANELMSNAFKHAFPDGRAGQIRIGFYLDKEVYTLSFADNGVGIPAGVDYLNTDSLGLKLVNLLATEQLDGTIQLVQKEGTAFIITFPKR